MNATAHTSRRLHTAALALLLVCAQALALVHEADHGVGAEQDRCTVCSIGGTLKHAAAAVDLPEAKAPPLRPCDDATPRLVPGLEAPIPEARAPPIHS